MATEVVNVPDLDLQFFGNDGKPMVNGKVVFFRNGTDIPESVYTSDGETSLGNTITLDSSGFPETQFSLIADKKYTVKLFDADDVLVWTRNDIQGTICGGPGPIGDFIPMDGTTSSDPVRGPLVWKDGDYENSTDAYGTTLTNDQGGSTVFDRSGLAVRMANDSGEYGATSLKIQNTQNGFPGYPNKSVLNDNSLTITKEVAGDGGVRVEKQVELKVASSNLSTNQLNFKGNTNIETEGGYLLVNSLGGVINITGKGIELNTSDSSKVVVGAQSKFIAKTLGIGTSLNNKEVNDIWTSTSTGTATDSQLITAKAALEAGGGGMSNPMTDEGDMIVGGVDGAPTRLPFGVNGQLLVMGASGPEWSDKPAACQENYSIIDSTGLYAASSYANQILTSKVIANVDRTYSQLGFGLKKGQTGGTGRFMMGIYDVSKNLIASTPMFQITETYQGQVYWVNTEANFKLKAGDEYYFAFWCEEYPGSNTIQFLGHQQVSTFDSDLVGILYGQSGLSEMPLSLGTLSYGQMVVHMAVR